MAFIHGKKTYFSLDGDDLSTYTNTSELGRSGDSHDITHYGADAHVYGGGLLDGKFTASGTFNDAVGGPGLVIEPLIGTVVPLVRRKAGTGVGKPEQTVDVLITNYTETAPVADYVKWSVEGQLSGNVVTTTQA